LATKKTASKTTASKKTTTSEKSPSAAEAKGVKPAAKAAKKAPATKASAEATVDVQAGSAKSAPTRAEISKLAHKYWEERGGHHGSHAADWARAERELKGE